MRTPLEAGTARRFTIGLYARPLAAYLAGAALILTACSDGGPAGIRPLPTTPAWSASATGGFAYVSTASNNVAVLNLSSNSVATTVSVGSAPLHSAATPDGKFVYVPNTLDNNVSIIRTSDNTVVGTVSVGSGPAEIAFTPDGSYAYVTNAYSSN